MVSSVSDEALGELVQGDGDAGLEAYVQECVFRDVVVVCCFLLVRFVVGAGVGETGAVEVVVVVVDGTAAAGDAADLGGLGLDVFAALGVAAEGAHASQGGGAGVRVAPHSEELLEAFLAAGFRVSEARSQFVAVSLVVAHERHDAVLDLDHGGPPGGLGEGLLVGGRVGGAVGGGVAGSGADGGAV